MQIELEENTVGIAEVLPTVILEYDDLKLMQLISKMEYVMLDNNYKTLHKPFFCKDYFNEIITTEIDGKSREQCGFKSKKFPIDILKQDSFKLGLINNINWSGGCNIFNDDKNFKVNLLLLLNQADQNRDYNLTTLEETTDTNIIVLNIDIKWLSTPVYWSFYTYIIRLAYNYTKEVTFDKFLDDIITTVDSQEMINSGEKFTLKKCNIISKYLFEGGKVLQTWEEYLKESSNFIHNQIGMINYFYNNYSNDLDKLKKDVK